MPLPAFVCRNGDLIPAAQAQIAISHPALYTSFGAYESIQCEDGVIFHLGDHLRRLGHSADLLELPLPTTLETIASWMPPLLAANNCSACLIRLLLLGPNGNEPALAFAWPEAPRVFASALYTAGATAILFQGARDLPQAKSLNTLVNFLAQRQAQRLGAHEGLLAHGGHIFEGASSNLFVVRANSLVMPPEETILSGVTLQIVLRLAGEQGIPVRSQLLAEADLATWDEAFITSTSRHVMPLTRVDGQAIGEGGIGPITLRLMDAFERYYLAFHQQPL
jgi:branched-subunit amino acid aminotransferase/4-amino-4-deoxychorismate lyase